MNAKVRFNILVCAASISLVLMVYVTSRAAGFSQTFTFKQDALIGAQLVDLSEPVPLILTDGQEEYPLGLYLEILEDPTGELTITEVSSPAYHAQFTPSQVPVPNYGYTDSVYWVRISLDNGTSQTNEWLLEIGFANTQYVDLYTPQPDGQGFDIKQTGVLRPVSTRDLVYPNIIFSLVVPTNSQQIYYLRFQNGASMTLPLTLWMKDAFIAQSGQALILHWLLFGGFVALLAYHLFLLVTLREMTYIYFVTLLAGMLLVLLEYTGYMGVYILPSIYYLKTYYFPLFVSLMYCSIILFSDTFLELPARFPRLHWVNISFLAGWGVLVLLAPFISYLSIARLMSPMQLVTILETLVIGVVAWRKDFLPVRFFLVAWLGMAASLLLLILVRLAIIPSTFFNENVFQLGFIVMAVAWSIALADRINLLKTETEKTNRDLLSSEHRLTQILEGMPLGVVVYGADQKPQYLNQRAVEILSSPDKTIRPDIAAGRNLEQAVEHFSFQVSGTNEKYPLEDLPVYHALNGRAASVDNIEANFGDRQIPLEIWASPVRDAAGNVESVVAAFQDISRRKQVETEVKEYRHQLETLVERRTAGLNAINKELRLRLEWFAAMNYVSQIVAQSTDFTKINEKIVEIINNLFTTQDSFIAELDSPSGKLKLLAHSCHSDVHPELTGSFTTQPVDVLPGSILEDGAIIFISRDQIRSMDGPLGIHILDSKVHNIAFVPLWLRDQVLGFLGLELDEAGRTFTHEESNLLSTFSTRIAQLIESARLFEQTKLLVAQEERDRLARDLHDSVTQALFSATLVAEVLPQIWRRDPEQGIQSLERLQRLMRGALAEMRTVLLELRPSVVVQTPLEELLTQLTEAVTSRSGLPFKLFIQKIPLLPEDVQISFYRIAQEALNNVVKHAQARLVTVSLSETGVPPDENCISGHQVRLEIRDDGVGFYSAAGDTGHLGMNIMRERAAAIQAELSLESQPGYGTLVRLIWCYASKSEDKHE